jgi:hypothetical protein
MFKARGEGWTLVWRSQLNQGKKLSRRSTGYLPRGVVRITVGQGKVLTFKVKGVGRALQCVYHMASSLDRSRRTFSPLADFQRTRALHFMELPQKADINEGFFQLHTMVVKKYCTSFRILLFATDGETSTGGNERARKVRHSRLSSQRSASKAGARMEEL